MSDAVTAEERSGAIVAWLRGSKTFSDLPSADLEAVAAFSQVREAAPGAVIFEDGDPADNLYLMIEGKVALERAIVLGRRTGARRATVDVVTAGDIFGLSAMVPPYQMTASAVSVEHSRFLAIDAASLRALAEARPVLGRELLMKVASLTYTRLREMTNRLSYLLSIASHDLKAPLAAVQSYLQVMIGGFSGPLSDRQLQMLERCSERISEALELVSNFLDMSRLEAGQMLHEMEVVSIENVVRKALDVVRPAAQDKGIALELDCPSSMPGIHAAALRLQQALVNVLSNAIKFTPAGGRVTLRLEDHEDHVRIEITDTGIGIPAEDVPYIFDDFYRGGNASEAAGTGLGLPVAKRIVIGHGGRIWAESPADPDMPEAKGSRFVIILPKRSSFWPPKPSR